MKAEKASIRKAYTQFVLENGQAPASVYRFCRDLELEEAEFYSLYSSFQAIDQDIIIHHFTEVIELLEKDEAYQAYSAREKYTAFLYAWVEHSLLHRSLFLLWQNQENNPFAKGSYMKALKTSFENWTEGVLSEAMDNRETIRRPFLSEKYPEALFLQFVWVHQFWLKDTSPAFEKTDAAIEKSVRLAFDLMGEGVLDSAMDLGKFLFQQVKG
ncbi:MAG: TetR/AcrR family transcriptional regulator [Bacteroidetes bacterium]|nr:MAG: TetR/AcrR family transcriptional regulator [Bacteroidota bacterium]